MRTLARVERLLDWLLQFIVIVLMVALTTVVVLAVIYRKAGDSFVWYDEVASVMLAWLTYYGAALAALRRQHIGFDGIIRAARPPLRLALFVIAEAFVFAFFIVLGWTGWVVVSVLSGVALVSLPDVSVQITQSVIPIGAALFILSEAVSLPGYWRRLRDGELGDPA